MSIERRSQVVQRDEALLPVEDNESWALSYIDLLLLMATLFVLLLSYQQEKIQQASENKQKDMPIAKGLDESAFIDQIYLSHLKDRVSVVEEKNTIKLAMSDSILFFPADATLSRSGERLLDEVAVMLRQRP
ncbi:MAG: hypothetical protein ACPG4B_01160 [Cycloclasticus sp.]